MSPIVLRLGELRKTAGLTQMELARRTGIDQPTISRLEQGRRNMLSLDTIDRLCVVLGCEPGDLLVREGKRDKGRGK